MRKILGVLMLLCTMTVFAAEVPSTYTGKLQVTVDGVASAPIEGQQVFVSAYSSSSVTLTIPNFSFAGISGTVTIKADNDGAGNLSNPTVSFGSMPIIAWFDGTAIANDGCHISLAIFAVTQMVNVVFDTY